MYCTYQSTRIQHNKFYIDNNPFNPFIFKIRVNSPILRIKCKGKIIIQCASEASINILITKQVICILKL